MLLLFTGIFLLFLFSKFHDMKVFGEDYMIREKILDEFSVVVAESGAQFQLTKGEQAKIVISALKPDSCTFYPHEVRNDTLFIFPFPNPEENKQNQEIYCPHIKSIVVKDKSRIRINEFSIDTLDISVYSANLTCSFKKALTNSGILTITASQGAGIEVFNLNIESLKTNLDQSSLVLQNTTIQNLSGSLTNGANLTCYNAIGKLNLEVDSTSIYWLNKKTDSNSKNR